MAATLPAVSDAKLVVSMLFVWPADEISWPFLSITKTTLALASFVSLSQTALIWEYSPRTSPAGQTFAPRSPSFLREGIS